MIAVHNLCDRPCTVTLQPDGTIDAPLIELLADQEYEPVEGAPPRVALGPYGYRWLRLGGVHRQPHP
jgi:maltose alpha-D-glucosyltransferase/alpha-amylase